MKTLINNGRIVTAVDDYDADILIEDETISMIGSSLEMERTFSSTQVWRFAKETINVPTI